MKRTIAELLEDRDRLLGPGISTFYDDPVHIVRGEGVWLWDAEGRKSLDCYNNVPHVGHCNPRVVKAICRQAGSASASDRTSVSWKRPTATGTPIRTGLGSPRPWPSRSGRREIQRWLRGASRLSVS